MPGPSAAYDAETWGARGAYFLARPTDWVRRTVETIDFEGARFGRRRLTIDIQLPEDARAIARQGPAGEHLYCVPVALLGKRHPRSKMDLLDQDGRRLVLLSRAENEVISAFALRSAMLPGGRHGLPESVEEPLLDLIAEHGEQALFQFHLFEYAAKRDLPSLTHSDAWTHLRHWAQSLINDSIVWLPVAGHAGEHKSLRMGYQIGLGPPTLLVRKMEAVPTVVQERRGPVTLPIDRPRGLDLREIAKRALNRIGVTLGFAAIDYEIRSPFVRGPLSYHFQVEAPPELEVRRIKLRAKLKGREGGEPRLESFVTPQSGHLYLTDHDVVEPGPIWVGLRAARTGLLAQAALAGLLIACALWMFATHWTEAAESQNSQTASAVLLLAPALLAVFIYRPSEHLLAARLLSGVRGLVLVAGLMAVSMCASLIGVVRLGMPPVHAARVFASVATAAALWMASMWVLALPWVRMGANRRRFWTRFEMQRTSWLVWALVAWATGVAGLALARAAPLPMEDKLERCLFCGIAAALLWFVAGLAVGNVRDRTVTALRIELWAVGGVLALAALASVFTDRFVARTVLPEITAIPMVASAVAVLVLIGREFAREGAQDSHN